MSDRRRATGADFLVLDPATAPSRGLTAWLAQQVRDGIHDGRLAPGAHLPASRALADELGVSRGAVVEAYGRLADEGLVLSRAGHGTVVAALPEQPVAAAPVAPAAPVDWTNPPRLPMTGAVRDVELDLSPGVPDLAGFPRAAWLKAERTVLARATSADLGYGDSRGHPVLREALASWLGRMRGVRAEPDDILVVAGVAQSEAILSLTLHTERDPLVVALEDPGSRGSRQALGFWGVRTVPVPVDDEGLVVDDLVRSDARAVLVTPAHQFPMGMVLSSTRRRGLLDWASGGGLVIEDDYDAEHRYDRAPVPALQGSAPDLVAYTGSVSKALAPGLRIGWLVAPARMRERLVATKHAIDLGCPALLQLVFAELLTSGAYARHLRAVRTRQRLRRDALTEALAARLPGARVLGVAAGLHLVLTFEPDVVPSDAVLAARLRERGVLAHPLSWYEVQPGPTGLVLGYATLTPDRLREAARRLSLVVDRHGG